MDLKLWKSAGIAHTVPILTRAIVTMMEKDLFKSLENRSQELCCIITSIGETQLQLCSSATRQVCVLSQNDRLGSAFPFGANRSTTQSPNVCT